MGFQLWMLKSQLKFVDKFDFSAQFYFVTSRAMNAEFYFSLIFSI